MFELQPTTSLRTANPWPLVITLGQYYRPAQHQPIPEMLRNTKSWLAQERLARFGQLVATRVIAGMRLPRRPMLVGEKPARRTSPHKALTAPPNTLSCKRNARRRRAPRSPMTTMLRNCPSHHGCHFVAGLTLEAATSAQPMLRSCAVQHLRPSACHRFLWTWRRLTSSHTHTHIALRPVFPADPEATRRQLT